MSTVTNTSGTTGTSSSTITAASTASALKKAGMSESDFLKLLVAQLSNQDPMNVQSQQEFMGQLAQFESLNQSIALNKNMESLSLSQGLGQSSSLIGKTVDYADAIDGSAQSGKVSSVRVVEGAVKLVVNNAQVDLTSIKGVS
jgi:flagellar basal-body rod modification protein FlgD